MRGRTHRFRTNQRTRNATGTKISRNAFSFITAVHPVTEDEIIPIHKTTVCPIRNKVNKNASEGRNESISD